MSHRTSMIASSETHGLTLRGYIVGVVSSLVLTLTAYLLVTQHVFSKHLLVGSIATLAFVQFIVQMLFFLHLGSERRPRWKLFVFAAMVIIVLILVAGTLWIMANLNYHMPSDLKNYLRTNEGL